MSPEIPVRLRRVAVRLFLNRKLRARHGQAMEADFRELMRAAGEAGEWAVLTAFLGEMADLARAGWQARGTSAGARGRTFTGEGGGGIMEATVRDARLAARGLLRRPAFTAVAVASLAFGIGGATAMFALVDGVLLRPLAFAQPERLTQVFLSIPSLGWERGPVPFPIFDEWRFGSEPVFESLSAFQAGARRTLTVAGEPSLVSGTVVTGETFATLGRDALHGRVLTPADEGPGREAVVVLSHAMWTEAFGADPAAVGARISLGPETHTIVGVMPADFPGLWAPERFWIPFTRDPASYERDTSFLRVIGRLRDGVDRDVALGFLERLVREQEAADPLGVDGRSVRVVSQAEVVTGDVRLQLLVLLGATFLLLAIACANLAGLLLVRGAARGRELALRGALGAGRARLVRELLTESVLLAGAGALLSVPLARALLFAVIHFGPRDLPRLAEVRMDPAALLFCLGVAALSAVAFGLVPALRSTLGDPRSELAAGGSGAGGPSGLQRGLVVAQVAVATVLMTGAGLLGMSLVKLESTDTGFDAERVLSFRVSPPEGLSRDEVDAFHARILEGIEALPGVTHAGATWALPLSGMYASGALVVEDRPEDEPVLVENVPVLGGYLGAMGMRVVRGRELRPGDEAAGETPILVGQTLAARAWPGEDAVGKRLLEAEDGQVEATYLVVGVVADVTLRGPGTEIELLAYWPHVATPWARDLYYVARTDGDPLALAPGVRDVVAGVDDRVPLADMSTMGTRLSRHLSTPRFRTALAAFFAGGAACLSLLGIYGVTSFTVGRRTREIGVRMALGAKRARVLTGILRGGLALVAVGVAVGLAAAAAGARVLETLLYQVEPLEPPVYVAVAAAVVVAAALACWIPAARAAAVSPTVALRSE